MNKPSKEQIKWFWEQCGFRPMKLEELPDAMRHPSNLHNRYMSPFGEHYGLPPIDLNNLFKYAVPKVREMRFMLNLSSGMLVSNTTVTLHKTKKETYQGFSEDPALALFWAIYKAFDS